MTETKPRSNGVDWRRRIVTLLVGVPMALRLLVSDTGMLLLVAVICALCLVEFSDNICAPILRRQRPADRRAHTALLVAASTTVILAAWSGSKDVYGRLARAISCVCRALCVASNGWVSVD